MLHTFYRIVILAFIITPPAFAASAASFALPLDAVIKIENFSFPKVSQHATEQNLPDLFHDRLTDALQKAGFALDLAADHSALAGAEQEKNLIATPITEIGEAQAQKPEENPPADEAKLAEVSTEDATEEIPAESADADQTGNATAEQTPSGQTPVEDDQSNVIQAVFASEVLPSPATYTLEGRVTLLRENLSAPTRIGGAIRIKAESVIHCTYRVKDASGKAIISAIASGSSVNLANTQNVDAVIADLTVKAMASAAETIASRLSGVDVVSSPALDSGKSYYQDSPGKRLKKE